MVKTGGKSGIMCVNPIIDFKFNLIIRNLASLIVNTD